MNKLKTYFDYASATPVDERVLEVMTPYFSQYFYNPSSLSLPAKQVAKDVADARARVAHWFGSRPTEVVFTAGGTEADNLAISGVMRQFPDSNLIVSAIEHEAVLRPAAQYDHRIVSVNKDGLVDLAKFEKLIDGKTVLISIMYANNEVGTIQPIRQIAKILQKVRTERSKSGNNLPIYLHTDACQAANYLDLHTSRLGVDMMTINAGKIYGPKQCGALYVKAGTRLQPQVLGGGQEKGLRSGTESVANIIGFAEALDLVQSSRSDETARLYELQSFFLSQINQKLPNALVNGTMKYRLPNNIHITLPGQDNERLLMELDEQGIMCAAGSACSASSAEPSHVLRAIGLNETGARSSLRFTMGRYTGKEGITLAVKALSEIIPG
jgi:cysteine desulfurase